MLAESDKTEKVEGNHYFPPDSIKQEYFKVADNLKFAVLRRDDLTTHSADAPPARLCSSARLTSSSFSFPSGQRQDDGMWLEGDIKLQEH